MTKKEIEDIEKRFNVPDSFVTFLYYETKTNELTEIATLQDGGAGLVMKGNGTIQERRDQFVEVWKTIERFAKLLKENAK